MQQASKNVEDNGRIIYIASSTTAFPVQGMAVYGGSKITPQYMVVQTNNHSTMIKSKIIILMLAGGLSAYGNFIKNIDTFCQLYYIG